MSGDESRRSRRALRCPDDRTGPKRQQGKASGGAKWRVLSLSMPLFALFFFILSLQGGRASQTLSLRPFLTFRPNVQVQPSWGVLHDREDFENFLGELAREDTGSGIDFSEEKVVFLIPGSAEGPYGRYVLSACREISGDGIAVLCEGGGGGGEIQLARVPRFEGVALFCFGEFPERQGARPVP